MHHEGVIRRKLRGQLACELMSGLSKGRATVSPKGARSPVRETDSHRDEYCFVPTNSKVCVRALGAQRGGARGRSGAWADLQGALELA